MIEPEPEPEPEPQLVARLRAAGCVYAEDEAAVLRQASTDPVELERLLQLRVDGAPLEHVVGWAEFCGIRVAVGAGVFVPRRRSEFLARRAREAAAGDAVILDMCCGTGALGIAAATAPGCIVHAVDSDPAAIAFAAVNLAPVGGSVYCGDLFTPLPMSLRGSVDVIVAVTPYVPSAERAFLHREARLYEPAATHDGGLDGLALAGRIVADSPAWLAPGGVVLLEVSAAQAPVVVGLAARHGLAAGIESDDDLDATIVVARASV